MKYCSECGALSKDTAKFCEKCGTRFGATELTDSQVEDVLGTQEEMSQPVMVAPGIVMPPSVEMVYEGAVGEGDDEDSSGPNRKLPEAQASALRSYFNIPAKDFIISSIGNNYLQNLLSGGVVRKTVACFTANRLYYQGCTYSGKKKSREVTSGSVLLRDITYTGITHTDPLGGKIAASVITALFGCMIVVGGFFGGLWREDPIGAFGGMLCDCGICAAAWYFLYIRKKFTAFRIDFPGSGIVFNMRNYSQGEVTEFKDIITKCIDHAKGI